MFILLATLIGGRHNQSRGAVNTLAEMNSSCIHHSNIWKFPGLQRRGKQRNHVLAGRAVLAAQLYEFMETLVHL